jgi:predicted NBD/HSP70 family sugar kinase
MIGLIDIGGTQIKFGIMDEKRKRFTFLGSVGTGTHLPDFSMAQRLFEVIRIIQEKHTIDGVAISTAGVVDPRTGTIVHANPNIPNYTGTHLTSEVEKEFGLPSSVENDVNCALLGEIHFGGLHDVQHALMFTIGTGVGGAVLMNGTIFHGSCFSAGEVGYTTLNRKNIEEVASAQALVSRVREHYPNSEVDGHWVFEEAKKGNLVCKQAIDAFLDNLNSLIMNSVALLNPEIVILGGGIMEQKEYLEPLLLEKFQAYGNKYVHDRTKLHFADLGNKAGILGAYYHYQNKFLIR